MKNFLPVTTQLNNILVAMFSSSMEINTNVGKEWLEWEEHCEGDRLIISFDCGVVYSCIYDELDEEVKQELSYEDTLNYIQEKYPVL